MIIAERGLSEELKQVQCERGGETELNHLVRCEWWRKKVLNVFVDKIHR